ncbi:mitochondrial coenzyme A transporter SLC25A42-like [Hetaerina americana]|uniref:mitochondrial coenzyme A transporter SLC25A42-like n=1 Tax=Hetaerina americana TaxID=62018 RepID=UPI003A7F25E6
MVTRSSVCLSIFSKDIFEFNVLDISGPLPNTTNRDGTVSPECGGKELSASSREESAALPKCNCILSCTLLLASASEGRGAAPIHPLSPLPVAPWGHHSQWQRRKMKTSLLSCFLAGAISSAIAKTAVAPLEWTKITFQVSDMRMTTRSMVSLLLKRAREDGPTALWRGNTAALVRVVPSSGIAFAANDALKHLLKDDRRPEEESKPARSFLMSAMAGTLAHSATYPLDLARTTMAVSSLKFTEVSLRLDWNSAHLNVIRSEERVE